VLVFAPVHVLTERIQAAVFGAGCWTESRGDITVSCSASGTHLSFRSRALMNFDQVPES
jgi:hypothetical protein